MVHTAHEQGCPALKFCACLTQLPVAEPPPYTDFSLFIVHETTQSFVALIITKATRGRHLTRNVKMGHNKLQALDYLGAERENKNIHSHAGFCSDSEFTDRRGALRLP